MTMDAKPPRWNETVMDYILKGLAAGAKVALLVPQEHLARYIGLLEEYSDYHVEGFRQGTVAFIPGEVLVQRIRNGEDVSPALDFIRDLLVDAHKDGWPVVYILNGIGSSLPSHELNLAYRLEAIWKEASEEFCVVTLCLYRDSDFKDPERQGLLVALSRCHNQFIRAMDHGTPGLAGRLPSKGL